MTNEAIQKLNKVVNEKLLGPTGGVLEPSIVTHSIIEKDIMPIIPKDSTSQLAMMHTKLNKTYYEAIDKRIKKSSRKLSIDCQKGCSSCCREINFDIPAMESEYVVDALNELENDKKIVIGQRLMSLREQFSEYSRQTKVRDSEEQYQHMVERQKVVKYDCPFLINDECSIYESRPVICRTYLSSGLEACLKNGKADTEQVDVLSRHIKEMLEHANNQLIVEGEATAMAFINPIFAMIYDEVNNRFYSITRFTRFGSFLEKAVKTQVAKGLSNEYV